MYKATVTVALCSSDCKNSSFAMKHSCGTYISIGTEVSDFEAKVLSMSSNATENTCMKFYIGEFQ